MDVVIILRQQDVIGLTPSVSLMCTCRALWDTLQPYCNSAYRFDAKRHRSAQNVHYTEVPSVFPDRATNISIQMRSVHSPNIPQLPKACQHLYWCVHVLEKPSTYSSLPRIPKIVPNTLQTIPATLLTFDYNNVLHDATSPLVHSLLSPDLSLTTIRLCLSRDCILPVFIGCSKLPVTLENLFLSVPGKESVPSLTQANLHNSLSVSFPPKLRHLQLSFAIDSTVQLTLPSKLCSLKLMAPNMSVAFPGSSFDEGSQLRTCSDNFQFLKIYTFKYQASLYTLPRNLYGLAIGNCDYVSFNKLPSGLRGLAINRRTGTSPTIGKLEKLPPSLEFLSIRASQLALKLSDLPKTLRHFFLSGNYLTLVPETPSSMPIGEVPSGLLPNLYELYFESSQHPGDNIDFKSLPRSLQRLTIINHSPNKLQHSKASAIAKNLQDAPSSLTYINLSGLVIEDDLSLLPLNTRTIFLTNNAYMPKKNEVEYTGTKYLDNTSQVKNLTFNSFEDITHTFASFPPQICNLSLLGSAADAVAGCLPNDIQECNSPRIYLNKYLVSGGRHYDLPRTIRRLDLQSYDKKTGVYEPHDMHLFSRRFCHHCYYSSDELLDFTIKEKRWLRHFKGWATSRSKASTAGGVWFHDYPTIQNAPDEIECPHELKGHLYVYVYRFCNKI